VRGRHKKWAKGFLESHPEAAYLSIGASDPFFSVGPLYLEIGAGKGDFVVAMSAKEGGRWLALERDQSVCAILAKRLLTEKIPSVRSAQVDFDFAYEQIKGLRFAAIYVNFPDPWPKKRHWKRRLATSGRLGAMSELLVPGGRIYLKTDNEDFFAFALAESQKTDLHMVCSLERYTFDEKDDAMSEYEKNFRSQGIEIHRLILEKPLKG
jgi:tRNA (guanine-N7-)-methyltransferase